MLSNFLNRYKEIQTIPETELATPFYHEIRFRVLDNDWWLANLSKLTKAFPNVCFCKRYVHAPTFGYLWSLILFGPREPEQLEEFCQDADTVITQTLSSSAPPKKEEVKSPNNRTHVISERVIYNEEGKPVGEARRIQLNCEESKMYNFDSKKAPRVFSGGSLAQMEIQVANAIRSKK